MGGGSQEKLKKEVFKEITKVTQHKMVKSTLEEEKWRTSWQLNVRVTTILKTEATPKEDGSGLCTKLGHKKDQPPLIYQSMA